MSKKFLSLVNLTNGATLPSSGSAGDLFFKSDELKIYVHDGTTWVIAQGSGGGGGVTVSATAPEDPTEGDYWFDSNTTKSYIYYDSYWVEVGTSGGGYIVSATAPSGASEGDVWFSTTEGVIYVYYDGYWVDPTTGGAAGVPTGGTTGQVLAKSSGDDYDTTWTTVATNLEALTDVDLDASITDKDILQYDSGLGLWVNAPAPSAGNIDGGVASTVYGGIASSPLQGGSAGTF